MLNEQQKEKLKYFINDPQMSGAVFQTLLNQFIKPKPDALADEKAARFIAIENLQDAWRYLDTFKTLSENQSVITKQVGL